MTANFEWSETSRRLPTEALLAGVRLRRGATWPWQALMLVLIALIAAGLGLVADDVMEWLSHRIEVLLVLGGIGCWRWSWFVLQLMRAVLYRHAKYPSLRRQALRAVHLRGPVPEVTILAVTYKEEPWITQTVFESVYRELSATQGLVRPARIVVATGCAEDERILESIHARCCQTLGGEAGPQWPPVLTLLRGDSGKRPALACALREVVASQPHPEGVVVFMDGDTLLQPGLLKKVLPMFRLKPEVGAVTTNEDGWVKGPRWFAEWISLRFGLRHRTMCSVALSGRLLCLTGRLSAFRASVALDPTFLQQIEHDSIHHWLWDSFDMLSGDDKSTWYWLAARGKRMLYVPDAKSTTVEVVRGHGAVKRAMANVRRWSGNSLRHSWRAMRIGPRRLGWFCWYSLLDQRLAMWTVLIGPMFALWALFSGHWALGSGYFLWVLLSRSAHASLSWWHGRRFSAFYLPLQIISDWTIALTKMWVLFHPARQTWLNRGARTLDTTRQQRAYPWRAATAHYLYGCACVTTIVAVGLLSGLLPVLRESPLILRLPVSEEAEVRPPLPSDRVRAGFFGHTLFRQSAPFQFPSASFPGPTSTTQPRHRDGTFCTVKPSSKVSALDD